MMTKRNSGWNLAALLVVLLLGLVGCRAFEPEAVIVNKAPETYIIGAPREDGGGYYHFHVFWYGSDEDGRVERFVWALTDTTVQDDDTIDDEEDVRFNPALDASTLAIANYTTKTDSVFSFRIEQGVAPSYDMTLHMVAVDDFGDYDETPARLHFFSNSLGNPEIRFFRITATDTIPIAFGQNDTVGYGRPYHVYWAGSSPNVRGFTPEALAAADTVYPFWDGLFGYKWQILGALGGNCVPALEDCWHPRQFDVATQDSFSFFGSQTSLLFENNGPENSGVFKQRLASGPVQLEVNSIDVAGVEVAGYQRGFSFIVNYDPETRLVEGLDPEHPDDLQEYPYYILLNDPQQEPHHFKWGDRIPDRTYVVVKALARDHLLDEPLNPDFQIGFTGYLEGVRDEYRGFTSSFKTEASTINYQPTWPALSDTGWYADTLGFLTGPRATFKINMQAVDEHGRRDGSPASGSFEVGYPPCLQCIELLPKRTSVSAYNSSLECYDGESSHPCFDDGVQEFRVTMNGFGQNELEFIQPTNILVDKASGFTRVSVDTEGMEEGNYIIDARLYRMEILLHGIDHPDERYRNALFRTLAWHYQVDYDCDPYNQFRDGGGNDDLNEPTWGLGESLTGISISSATGLWKISVDIAVPTWLVQLGPNYYRTTWLPIFVTDFDYELADELFALTTRMSGLGRVSAIALDQTRCGEKPLGRPAKYNLFEKVRPTVSVLPGVFTWRDCYLSTDGGIQGISRQMDLSLGAMASSDLDNPAVKEFRIIIQTGAEGDFECTNSGF